MALVRNMPEYSEKMTLEKSSEDDCTLTSSGIENEMTGGTPVKAMKTLSNTLRQPLETAKEFADNLNLRQKNQSVSTLNGSKDEGDETRTTHDTVRRVEVDKNRVRSRVACDIKKLKSTHINPAPASPVKLKADMAFQYS